MTLQVSFDQFAETVKRLLNQQEAFVTAHNSGTLVTAAKAEKSMVVASISSEDVEATTQKLKESDMAVYSGTWLTPEELMAPATAQRDVFIAAVAYRSGADKPGLWVDAYTNLPSQIAVLRAMYDEFRETGEVDDVTFEEFVQIAGANVVVLTPTDIDGFIRQKEGC